MNTDPRMMLARRLTANLAKRRRRGFTLIELLVVVVIIGILASMALPSFLGAQDKAKNASVQANVKTIQMGLEEYSVDTNGAFPDTGAWTTAAVPFAGNGTRYLPGGKIPVSPWAKLPMTEPVSTGTNLEPIATVDFNGGANPYTPLGTIIAPGAVPAAGAAPAAMTDYGCMYYEYDANSQFYLIYSSGKKAKDAMLAARASNGGN